MQNIKTHLAQVLQEIHTLENQYARQPQSVSLLAVSKQQSIEKIKEAVKAGQHAFGENYLQEALIKISALSDQCIVWHFIGPLQRNKTKKIAEHFAWVQSISDLTIAQRLNDQRPLHLPALNICLQINISEEKTKSGVWANDLLPLAQGCVVLPRLQLRGIMAIPAPKNTFIEQAKEFHKLRALFEYLRNIYPFIDTLSMGMSNDFAAAIAEGATMIRVGTKIFGKR